MSSAWNALAGVLVGGFVTGTVTFVMETVKEGRARAREERGFERTLETRWDDKLAEVAADFVATVRTLLHTARRLDRSPDLQTSLKHLDEVHERLRSLSSELGLLADGDGQLAARDLLRLSYQVRLLGERDAPQPEQDVAHDNVLESLVRFQVAVRRQLRVPAADQVLTEVEYGATTQIVGTRR